MRVRAEGIRKEYIRKGKLTNVFTAVDSCDIQLEPGKLIVVKGRSGGGKSTLLNMLSGILRPTAGCVFYDDVDIYGLSDASLSEFRNRNIGYIPQGKSAIMSLTVMENILLPDMFRDDRHEKEALRLMERYGIDGLKNVMPEELSGGELRRMAIARALLNDPGVIYADEPTGDLDDDNTKLVLGSLREAADGGAVVFLVTHEGEADKYADKAYIMDAGVINE